MDLRRFDGHLIAILATFAAVVVIFGAVLAGWGNL